MFASILTSCHGTYIILRKLVYVFIYTKHMGTTNRSTTGLSEMQGPVLFSLREREHFYPPESSFLLSNGEDLTTHIQVFSAEN